MGVAYQACGVHSFSQLLIRFCLESFSPRWTISNSQLTSGKLLFPWTKMAASHEMESEVRRKDKKKGGKLKRRDSVVFRSVI